MEEIFRDFGKVFIRTPLYSYLSLFDDNNETKNLEDTVRFKLADPVFLEALYWSSPQLFEAVLKFKGGNLKGPKEDKLMHTLKKYLIRASTRCTPYGIYAGTSLLNLDLDQDNPNRKMERKVRVDMPLLHNIKSRIESDPEIYPHLLYSINNSLYSIPGQYRFVETIVENGKSNYQLSSLDHTNILEKIVNLAKGRLISFADIYGLLEKDASVEEINAFINDLIQTQFLVSELQLGLTAGTQLSNCAKVLGRLSLKGNRSAKKYLHLLSTIENVLNQFKNLPLGVLPVEEIEYLKDELNEFGIGRLQDHLFHADLKKATPDSFVFPGDIVDEVKKGIFILGKLSNNSSPDEKNIEQFKKLFEDKYGTREIPLAEVLDPEFGIGFPPQENIGNTAYNSLLENLDISSGDNKKIRSRNWQFFLRDKIGIFNGEIIKDGIQLHDEDLKDFDDKVSTLSNTFSVMGRLLPSGKILLENVGGAHANSLLGRFAYLEEEMGYLCKELTDTEMRISPKVIFAEIVFIPEGRLGNIARRPILTEYEIPFLSSSSVAAEKQIPIDDLLVSVQKNNIILRSKKLNQRVIPRLSNAHNFINSQIPIYKFLSSIQFQGTWGFYISWDDFAAKKNFLPRISYRNIILHRACWFLQKKDISTIIDANNPFDKLRALFLKWEVPRFVSLAEGDNELFLDTSNDCYLEILIEEIKNRDSVKLVEWLYDSVVKKSDEDRFSISQFVLPLARKNTVNFVPFSKSDKQNNVEHNFEPGSEWVYFKIYCSATLSDNILLNVIKPAIHLLLKDRVINRAFFIRYADPHYHIRFRLHLADSLNSEHLAIVLKCVYDLVHPFTANRMIWKFQLDSYQRETERYGEMGILASEDLFFHDSLFYLNCLQHQDLLEDQQVRFLGAIKNLDRWLNIFKMPFEEKLSYCTNVCKGFAIEYGKEIKFQLDMKYRELNGLLPSFLNSDKFEHEFNERDKSLNEIIIPKENIGSYIHMSMNRWFCTQQRLMEYMCYIFCRKYYQQTLHHNQRTTIKKDLKS